MDVHATLFPGSGMRGFRQVAALDLTPLALLAMAVAEVARRRPA